MSAIDGGGMDMPTSGETINLGASLTGIAFLQASGLGRMNLNNPTFTANGHTFTGNTVQVSQNSYINTTGATPFGTGSAPEHPADPGAGLLIPWPPDTLALRRSRIQC